MLTENQLLDLAQQAGIPTDSPTFAALKLRYLHRLSFDKCAAQAGVAKQTVRYASSKIEAALNPRSARVRAHTSPRRCMPEAQLLALCELAGRLPPDCATYAALRHHYVDGQSQAASAMLAGVHPSTVSNAQRRIELTQLRLAGLAETVRRAQG